MILNPPCEKKNVRGNYIKPNAKWPIWFLLLKKTNLKHYKAKWCVIYNEQVSCESSKWSHRRVWRDVSIVWRAADTVDSLKS